ncbi:MAG: hypothetical protein K8F91_26965, partial [Candidatus Obscuribacterales bacterium]|nr:hypothetical protein [Candidatus Obscuribacterales bacterium]
MTTAAPQPEKEAAKDPPAGADKATAVADKADAAVEKNGADKAAIDEVQKSQGAPKGGSTDTTADASDATTDSTAAASSETVAQREAREEQEKGSKAADTLTPEQKAKLVANGVLPDVLVVGDPKVAVTTDLRKDGPEAGGDQPGMVK